MNKEEGTLTHGHGHNQMFQSLPALGSKVLHSGESELPEVAMLHATGRRDLLHLEKNEPHLVTRGMGMSLCTL